MKNKMIKKFVPMSGAGDSPKVEKIETVSDCCGADTKEQPAGEDESYTQCLECGHECQAIEVDEWNRRND